MKVRKLAELAALSSVAVLFLWLSSVMPTGQLGFAAAASLPVFLAAEKHGVKGALMTFAASSAVALLLAPRRTPIFAYVLFLGYYPAVRMLAGGLKTSAARWALKLLCFNAAFAVTIMLFRETVFDIGALHNSVPLAFAAGNAVFVLFDVGVGRLLRFSRLRFGRFLEK